MNHHGQSWRRQAIRLSLGILAAILLAALAAGCGGDQASPQPQGHHSGGGSLTAPTGLAAAAVSFSRIDLSWIDTSGNETSFVVERSTAPGAGYVVVAQPDTNATAFSDTVGLAGSTTYYYRVLAQNGAGISPYSNTASATTAAAPIAPAAPSGLTVTGITTSAISLSWADNATNETAYVVQRAVILPTTFVDLVTLGAGATAYSDTGLPEATTFHYRVKAVNGIGSSAFSNTASATTGSSGGDPVLTLQSVAGSSITLEWSYRWPGIPHSTGDGYQLEESTTSPSGGFTQIYNTVGTDDRQSPKTYTVPTRPAGTYYYRVRASDKGVFTAWSNVEAAAVVSAPVTQTFRPARDNAILVSSLDSSLANTAYPSGSLDVGCSWGYAVLPGIQNYVCSISLLYFDINATLSGKTITSATLRLYPLYLPGDYGTTYQLWAVYDPWNASVTWNTMPRVYLSPTRLFPQPVSLLPTEIDVTAIVQGWADGSLNNYGFFLEDTDYTFPFANSLRATSYCSMELYASCGGAAYRPHLEITYQ